MSTYEPYNPLDKANLGQSVADALLKQPVIPMEALSPFDGAGTYAIYYLGNFQPYLPISEKNRDRQFSSPIYVGKAVPQGARKGLYEIGSQPGPVLFNRLREHASSIAQAENLVLSDFYCRFLVVDDIWIPLGESLLINRFNPLWNSVIDGFGNHDPGGGRYK